MRRVRIPRRVRSLLGLVAPPQFPFATQGPRFVARCDPGHLPRVHLPGTCHQIFSTKRRIAKGLLYWRNARHPGWFFGAPLGAFFSGSIPHQVSPRTLPFPRRFGAADPLDRAGSIKSRGSAGPLGLAAAGGRGRRPQARAARLAPRAAEFGVGDFGGFWVFGGRRRRFLFRGQKGHFGVGDTFLRKKQNAQHGEDLRILFWLGATSWFAELCFPCLVG